MIYHSSQDPVLLKKIKLRIWPLADEVKTKIETALKDRPEESALLQSIQEEYGNFEVLQGGKDGGDLEAQGTSLFALSPDKVRPGMALIAEVEMSRIHFFTNTRFLEGQAVVIEFMIPRRFMINADVLCCYRYNPAGHIISPRGFTHRLVAAFTFLRRGERTLLRQFLHSISPREAESQEETVSNQREENLGPKAEDGEDEKSQGA